ncbi:MAG: DUF4399 domain-containing protein [Gammaproteobacteria bacterium]
MPLSPVRLALACCLAACGAVAQAEGPPPAPTDAEVYFISPMNGEHVTSPVTVRFGLRGMGVAPAGVDMPDTGHHHLLVDADPLPDLSQALPASDEVVHFGKGQTETRLELPPGKHTLQLVMGNALHIPFAPPVMSGTIEITVVDE